MIHRAAFGLMAALAFAGGALAAEDTLAGRLSTASPDQGARTFIRCRGCHTIEQGGKNKVGPNLWGVVGREVAAAAGYERYSKAISAYGGVWTPERLDAFLEKPQAEVKGTRMGFSGLRKASARAGLIAYLNQNGPAPISFAATDPAAQASTTDSEAPDYGVLVIADGVEETYAYCSVCHSERLVAQQGLDRADWAELLEWMVEEQSMAEIDEPDRSVILDYLTTNYNIDRPNFPKP